MTAKQLRTITEKLKRLARERDTNYAHILTQFLIERAVARLTATPLLRSHLVFKGGFVGLCVYGSPRYTIDLDAVSFQKNSSEILIATRTAMETTLDDCVWFVFQDQVDLTMQNEYGGTRLQYRAGLGDILPDLRRAQILNLDIGTGDPITPAPRLETTQTIGHEAISWLVYPIETIIAEKLHPFIQRGAENSRSKDIYDLAFYLPHAQRDLLAKAIERTFAFRGDCVPADFAKFLDTLDRSLLRRGWPAATKSMKNPADFDQTFEIIVTWLRRHGL